MEGLGPWETGKGVGLKGLGVWMPKNSDVNGGYEWGRNSQSSESG